MALLHVFDAIATDFDLKLGVAHLNHGLRGTEADRDADFVAEAAARLGFKFYGSKRDVLDHKRRRRLSLEEAARQVRYEFFETIARQNGYNRIATGHHADDNAELVLMNFLRGAGPQGFSGIPYIRPSPDGQISIVRPLLDLTKDQIAEFMAANDLKVVVDRTNFSLRHTRNRIRHKLIPLLKTHYNENIIETLNRTAEIFTAEQVWVAQEVKPRFDSCLLESTPDRVVLCVKRLCKNPLAVRRRIVRQAIKKLKGSLRGVTLSHTEAVLALMKSSAGTKQAHLPGGLQVERTQKSLIFSTGNAREVALQKKTWSYAYNLAEPGAKKIPEAGVTIKVSLVALKDMPDWRQIGNKTAYCDADAVSFPLTVRNFKPGDRFKPLGLSGSQKVKDFFINNKVDPKKRRLCPLVLHQEKIIWIAGYRVAESVKIGPQTRNVLKMELLLA